MVPPISGLLFDFFCSNNLEYGLFYDFVISTLVLKINQSKSRLLKRDFDSFSFSNHTEVRKFSISNFSAPENLLVTTSMGQIVSKYTKKKHEFED